MDDYWGLRRSVTDAPVAGVCSGLAEHWRIDPLVVRLVTVLAMLSAGIGVVLYIAAVLLVPTVADEKSQLEKMYPQSTAWPKRTVLVVVALTALCVAVVAGSIFPLSIMPVLVMAGAWYFGVHLPRQRATVDPFASGESAALPATVSGTRLPQPVGRDEVSAPVPAARVGRTSAQFFPQYRHSDAIPLVSPPPDPVSDFLADYRAPAPPPTRKPDAVRRRRRSTPTRRAGRLRWAVLATMSVSVLAIVVTHLTVVRVPVSVGFAIPAAIGAVGLIIATWVGRARGIMAPTVVTVLAALVAIAPQYVAIDVAGFTEDVEPMVYTEMPDEITSQLRDIDADLTRAPLATDHHLVVTNDIGNVTLRLPGEVTVIVTAASQVGNLYNAVTDERMTGIPAQAVWEFPADHPDAPVLTIDVTTSLGDVEVMQ